MKKDDDDKKDERAEAERLRDEGMERAADHAEREIPEWRNEARRILEITAALHRNFTSEDIKIQADIRGLPRPPEPRAWGAVIQRAARDGIIRKVGWADSTSRTCHCRPMQLWTRA